MLRTVKSNLELNRELKSTLSPEEFCQEVSDVDHVPGSYYFLKNSTTILKENPRMRDELSILILCVVVSKMSRNHNPTFPLKVYNFYQYQMHIQEDL